MVFVWEGYVFCIFHLGRENVPIWSPKWYQNGTLNPPESHQERPEEAKRHHGTPPNTTLRMHDFELQKKTKKYQKCSRLPPRDPPPGVPGGRVGKGLPYRLRRPRKSTMGDFDIDVDKSMSMSKSIAIETEPLSHADGSADLGFNLY